jgi:RNA polymerase sigma-70 factor (ECF subfamily)
MPTAIPTDDEYARLVEPYRSELHAHCCRMLRSSDDAEDALQEALLRAWRGLPSFEGRSSLRAWLYKISTNACLDAIERRRRRVLPLDGVSASELAESGAGEWLDETPDNAPTPDVRYESREALEHVVLTLLEQLSPQTRTAFVLRFALGLSAREVAARLGTSVASVNSSCQRGRSTLLRRSQMPDGRLATSLERRHLSLCADAIERGDANGVISLLRTSPWAS